MLKNICLVATLLPGLAPVSETSIEELLAQLKVPKQGTEAQEFGVTETEANAWAVDAISKQPKLGVKDLRVDFRAPNIIATDVVVDLDQVELEGYSAILVGNTLTGLQKLEVVGNLKVSEGKGAYTVESARLNGVDIPAWLANALLSYLSTNQPPNVDVTKPFPLPYGIRDIRLTQEMIIIVR